MAALVAALAVGGEVLVSSTVRDAMDRDAEIDWDEGRDVEPKGLRGTHRLYAAQRRPAVRP